MGEKVEFYSLGESGEKVESNLNWSDGSMKVFSGNVMAKSEIELTVSRNLTSD